MFKRILVHLSNNVIFWNIDLDYWFPTLLDWLTLLCLFGFRFSNLTGVDYSEGAINLARGLAERDGYKNVTFSVYFWSKFFFVRNIYFHWCNVSTNLCESRNYFLSIFRLWFSGLYLSTCLYVSYEWKPSKDFFWFVYCQVKEWESEDGDYTHI